MYLYEPDNICYTIVKVSTDEGNLACIDDNTNNDLTEKKALIWKEVRHDG